MATFFIFVGGTPAIDQGEHDAAGNVVRAGGGPLTFKTQAEATKAADALYASAVERAKARRMRPPTRDRYVVASEPAPVPDAVDVPPVG